MAHDDALTLAGVIERQASERPDWVVLTVEGGGTRPDDTRTYAELWRRAHWLATGLRQQGIQRGQRVGSLMANHAEFVDLMVACSLLGAVLVPIDPRTRGDKLVYMLDAVECQGLVVADYALGELERARDRLRTVKWLAVLATDESPALPAHRSAHGAIAMADLLVQGPVGASLPGCAPDDPLELLYTSGTTGDPKAIVMTHRRYVTTVQSLPALFGFTAEDRLYSGLSLTHANAQLITLGVALVHAIPCVLSRRFTKSRLWSLTRHYGCTSFTLLGGMTTAIYAEPPRPDDADNPVRLIISAGMPAAIWRDFERRFRVDLLEFYGSAEGGLTVNPIGAGPVGSIGKPVPSLTYRIVDDQGIDVEPDAHGDRIGELLFQPIDGTPFKVAYHGNEEASRKKGEGGWLHMGDVVRADRDGWLYFMFRKGGGIRRNGDFIDPAFIEKVIAEDPAVDDVYVYGVASAKGGVGEKDVIAAVVPKPDSRHDFDIQRLFYQCRKRLEPNFVPSFIQVLEAIPKTASEKPLERLMIEYLKRNPDSVHCEIK